MKSQSKRACSVCKGHVCSLVGGACVLHHTDVTLDDAVLLGNAEQGGAGGQHPAGKQPEA